MRYGSGCSGIEAATVAWHPLGWKPVWFSEIDKAPSAVLKHHYPKVKNLGDMTKIHQRKEFKNGAIDLLVGGTPCQSFSIAGLRKGMADPRGNLALVFLSLVDRARPRWVVWENVPGVLSSWTDGEVRDSSEGLADLRSEVERLGRILGPRFVELGTEFSAGPFEESFQTSDYDAFASGLRELGYGVAWRVLDAQYFGVPQRRRRVFVVGYIGDWRPAATVLFERDCLSGNPPPSREAREGFAAPTRGSSQDCKPISIDRAAFNQGKAAQYDPQISDDGKTPSLVARGPHAVAHTLQEGGRLDSESETLIAHTLKAEHDASEDGTGRGVPLTVTPIDMRQASRGEKMTNNRADGSSGGPPGTGIGEPGDPAPTVAASHVPAIAFGSRDHGHDALEEISPTLRSGNEDKGHANGGTPPAVVYSIMPQNSGKDYKAREVDVAQPLLAAGPSTGNQGGDIIVDPAAKCEDFVFESRVARNGRGAPEPVCPPLKAQSGETGKGDSSPLVFTQNSRSEVRDLGDKTGAVTSQPGAQCQNYVAFKESQSGTRTADIHATLDANKGSRRVEGVMSGMAVRRLTPRECERLQGFPDDYTLIRWRKVKRRAANWQAKGKQYAEIKGQLWEMMADGPRYKMLGNSMAVPVMAWIGRRIDMVEKVLAK